MNSTYHNFTVGAPIRKNSPLSMDEIRRAAPSAFATEAYSGMSGRYTYIPTSAVIENMLSAGFQVYGASQSRTRVEGKKEHTKHMIRFRAPNTQLAVGDVFPELALVNSHDGSSAYKLMGGLYRLVCSNGLTVADSVIESIHVRHTGNILNEVATGSVSIVEHMPVVIDAVRRWKEIQLSEGEKMAFAEAAHVLRFGDADGNVDTPIQPKQLLHVRRMADGQNDLWSVFNRVQENVIKGGLHAYAQGAVRRTGMREVKGIDQDIRLNRSLWTLGEKLAEYRA